MEKNRCWECKNNEADIGVKNVSFRYQDMEVKTKYFGAWCAGCAEAKWVKKFEENAQEFITAIDGKPKVEWQRYHKHFGEGHFHDQKEILHVLLVDLGVLSYQTKGNWEIVADGPIGLNPRAHLSYLYFTRGEDATEFACLMIGRTSYGWEIRHIDEVISKNDIIVN